MTKSLNNYLTYKTKNCGCSVDTHFQNQAGSVLLSLLPIKAAYTSFINVWNKSPLRIPKMPEQKSLMVQWLSFSGWGRVCISLVFDYKGSQYIQKRQWHTNVNILWLAVGYLNVTRNRKPEDKNQRLEQTGLAKSGKTHGLTGTGLGLACPKAAGRVFGWVWNQTEPFLRSKPGPLAGSPDPLLRLFPSH